MSHSFAAQTLRFESPPDQSPQSEHLQNQFEQAQAACQQLQAEVENIQAKLPSMTSGLYRQNAETRARSLLAQLKAKQQTQRNLGLKLRQQLIKNQLSALTAYKAEHPADAAFSYAFQTCFPPILAALTQPPYGGQAWVEPLQQCQILLTRLQQEYQAQANSFKTSLIQLKQLPLPAKAEEQEKNLIKRYLLLLENLALQIQQAHPASPPVSGFPNSPAANSALQQGLGERIVSFDFSTRKSVVKDQLGTRLNQPQRPYEEALQAGMQQLEQGFAKFPPALPLLQAAITELTEAISSDPKRYEAYFSLGYLFANLEDWPRAIKLLQTAVQLSQREDIQAFLELVRQQTHSNRSWQN